MMKVNRKAGRLPILIIIIILAFAGIGIMRRCTIEDSTLADDYIRPGHDTIAVAIEMSPLTYTLRHDTASGFDYDILCDIARTHNLHLKFHPVSDLDRAFRGLDEGKYDLLVASMPATTALKEFFPLTEPVYIDRQVLVQRRDSDSIVAVTSQKELLEDTVWIPDGAPYSSRLKNLAAELGGNIYFESKPEYSAEHLAIMTALGNIPRAVVNENIARHLTAEYPQLDISVPISLNQFQVWAVAPGDSILLDSVNSWLLQFKQTAAYDSLTTRYIGAK